MYQVKRRKVTWGEGGRGRFRRRARTKRKISGERQRQEPSRLHFSSVFFPFNHIWHPCYSRSLTALPVGLWNHSVTAVGQRNPMITACPEELCHRKFGSINSKLQRAVGRMANSHMKPAGQCTNILLEEFHPKYDNKTAHQGELGTSPIFRGFSVVWHVWSDKLGKYWVIYNYTYLLAAGLLRALNKSHEALGAEDKL